MEGGDTKPKPPEKKKWGGPSDTLLSNLEKKLGEGAGSGEGSSKPSVPEKKKWAGPSDTLLNALAQKSVVSGTLSGESSGKFYFFLYLRVLKERIILALHLDLFRVVLFACHGLKL